MPGQLYAAHTAVSIGGCQPSASLQQPSILAAMACFDCMPTMRSTSRPSLKKSSVGMPATWYLVAMAGLFCTSSLSVFSLPSYSSAMASTVGARALHGPHHSAHRSTSPQCRLQYLLVEALGGHILSFAHSSPSVGCQCGAQAPGYGRRSFAISRSYGNLSPGHSVWLKSLCLLTFSAVIPYSRIRRLHSGSARPSGRLSASRPPRSVRIVPAREVAHQTDADVAVVDRAPWVCDPLQPTGLPVWTVRLAGSRSGTLCDRPCRDTTS